MLQNIMRGLCCRPSGVILVAGAIGVLTGVERLMSGRGKADTRIVIAAPAVRPVQPKAVDRFTIRRTKSDLGYTYWVLQGHGRYTGFALFDTWQEAMDEMQRRSQEAEPAQEMLVPAVVTV